MATSGFQSFDGEGLRDRERDDLAALLASPGWAVFCEHVASVWAEVPVNARLRGLQRATTPVDLGSAVGALLAQQDAVESMMSWPKTRVHHLTTPVRTVRAARRARA